MRPGNKIQQINETLKMTDQTDYSYLVFVVKDMSLTSKPNF